MDEFTPQQLQLMRLRDERFSGNAAALARAINKDQTYVHRLFYPAGKKGGKGIGLEIMEACSAAFDLPPGYWEGPRDSVIVTLDSPQAKGIGGPPAVARGKGQNDPDIIIPQYEAGGGMGASKLVLAEQPGLIKSWNVDHEWIRQNVRHYTSLDNLCIVTGFGPSMKPLFNPGDPLLVDIGVKTVDHDAIFFFRIGEDGYIKQLQRIPDLNGGGRVLRAKSMNERYDPFDISPANPHFEVLGKVLTVWCSEQF